MKIVVAPDSFKGNMTMLEVSDVMASGIKRVFPDASIEIIPVADGGEGTTEALAEGLGGKMIDVSVMGPMGKPMLATYGY